MSEHAASGYMVRFARLERRGVLLGLSGPRLALVAAAAVVFVGAEFTAGVTGVVMTAPVWAGLGALGAVVVAGRPLLDWLPLLASWGWRRVRGATTYLRAVGAASRSQDLCLPTRRRLRLVTTATGAVAVWDRRARTVTAVVEVQGRGFVLADPGAQDARVAAWGRVLAGLCRQPEVARVQVLHRIGPGGGVGVRRWWAEHAVQGANWATQVVADVLADTIEDADRHQCLIAFALRVPRGPRRGATTIAERQVPALTAALAAADLDVIGWLTPEELSRVVRTAYDPAAARLDLAGHPEPESRRTQARREHRSAQRSAAIGPMGMIEEWDRLRTDTAWHAVYWVAEWPRTATRADFLHPLLLAPATVRSFTLIAEPLPTGAALRRIRGARVAHASDSAQRARTGRLEEETMLAEVDDITRREQDLVAGHGDLSFTGLLTVTAPTTQELDAACTATETAAAQAMCEVRRLVGQQSAAHTAAALPLAARILR